MVIPKHLKVRNSNFVEDVNQVVTSVVTICNEQIVSGYFPKELVIEVRKELKERYKIPRLDPKIDPKWHMEEKTNLENMVYLTSIFLDQIPRNLTSVWSQIIKRDVMRPERFQISSLTSQEMQRLRSEYVNSELKKVRDTCIEKKTDEENVEMVSTCMSSLSSKGFPLLQVAVVVNQTGNKNLIIEKAIIDTPSQISIFTFDYVEKHRHVEGSMIRPMMHSCSLKSATGRALNPFVGKIDLCLKFVDKWKKTSKKILVEFHVLEKDNELQTILLGRIF